MINCLIYLTLTAFQEDGDSRRGYTELQRNIIMPAVPISGLEIFMTPVEDNSTIDAYRAARNSAPEVAGHIIKIERVVYVEPLGSYSIFASRGCASVEIMNSLADQYILGFAFNRDPSEGDEYN